MAEKDSVKTTIPPDVREKAMQPVPYEEPDGKADRRALEARREQVALEFVDQKDLGEEARTMWEGLMGRMERSMAADAVLPSPDERGVITGSAAARITRSQWLQARESGCLIVFYGGPEGKDLKGRIFTPTGHVNDGDDTIGGVVDHARMIHLPGNIAMASPISPHDYKNYLDRVNREPVLGGTEGEKMSLGFGDKKEGVLNVDAMAIAICVQEGGKTTWMKQAELLPLMRLADHPNMQALHYGSALFEGMGCERDPETGDVCIFDLEGHYNRMRKGAETLDLPCPSLEMFRDMAIKMVQANERFIPEAGKGRLYLRPNLFSIGPWMKVGNAHATALVFTATPIGNAESYFGEVKEEMVFGVPTNRLRSTKGLPGDIKVAGNYAATIRAIHIMEELGLKGGVAYLDRLTQMDPFPLRKDFKRNRDWLAAMAKWGAQAAINFAQLKRAEFKETSASNLIAFEDLGAGRWRVVTPPLTDGDILGGRTRNLLKTIVEEFGWEYVEGSVTWRDIESGKYKFMAGAGTAAYLTPIHAFQRVDIGTREELGEVDAGELEKLQTEDEKRAYQEKPIGKKVGEVVHLLGRSPQGKDELFPLPLKRVVERMEEMKRGRGGKGYESLITRVSVP